MASSEKVHYSVFPIAGTVNDRGLILYVEEKHFTTSTNLVDSTTLANFMTTEDIPKGDSITQGFGSYIYREQLPKEGNRLRFIFLKNKTASQQLEVVRPARRINQVTDWPDWLISLYALEVELDKEIEQSLVTPFPQTTVKMTRILDRYILIRGGQFNTVHIVEEFFSPVPIPSLSATEPRPDTVFYNYQDAVNRLDCIHQEVRIPEPYLHAERVENFGTPDAREVDWPEGSIFPATNHTSWIPHFRILNVSEQDGGFFYRRHQVLPPKLPRAIQI